MRVLFVSCGIRGRFALKIQVGWVMTDKQRKPDSSDRKRSRAVVRCKKNCFAIGLWCKNWMLSPPIFQSGFCAIGDPQFGIDVAEMEFYGVFTQVESCTDLGIAQPFGKQFQNLLFTLG